MKFDYSAEANPHNPTKPWWWRPVLKIAVTGPNGTTVPVLGLVDSGADITLFDFSLAKLLGVDLDFPAQVRDVGIHRAVKGFRVTALDAIEQHVAAQDPGRSISEMATTAARTSR